MSMIALLTTPVPAAAQGDSPTGTPATPEADRTADDPGAATGAACAAVGYVVGSSEELRDLRIELQTQSAHPPDGVPLEPGQVWELPDGGRPVIVLDGVGLDGAGALSDAVVTATYAGRDVELSSSQFGQPNDRYVTHEYLQQLGPVVRSLGLSVTSGPCAAEVVLAVDRSGWSTVVGGAAAVTTVLAGVVTVLLARRSRGGWGRRFGTAAFPGVVLGFGQAVVLLEAGVVSPFGTFPWWAPAAGLGLAGLLPLTRWPRQRQLGAQGGGTGPPPVLPHPSAPLGAYQIEQAVAQTGTAVTYLATTAQPGAPALEPGPRAGRVLVKVALPQRYGEPAVRLRLEREARVLGDLRHPNLIQLREWLTGDGPPTLVFEHVDGAPLRQLAGGATRLTDPQAVTVVLGVLAGLEAVHAAGLVHRDVSPDNVWLGTDGRVVLVGFELACAGVEHPVAPEGTAPYASPEQQAGRALDGRSDLWACGLLLRELLADPSPAPVAQVLARATAEDPAGRPASAGDLAEELRQAAAQAYGPDLASRGALAGAVVANVSVGSATAGYVLAGAASGGTGAAGVAGPGAGAGAGDAGLGAAAGAANQAVAGAGPAWTVGPAGSVAGSAAGSTAVSGVAAGHSGVASTLVNIGVAVAAGAAVTAGVALTDPAPAAAEQTVVVTPDQARVIFIQTMREVGELADGSFEDAEEAELIEPIVASSFTHMFELYESLTTTSLTAVEVGVPPEQYGHPAWFTASGQLPFDDGVVHLQARLDRESSDQPWRITSAVWLTDEPVGTPMLDDDGRLAAPPDPAELVVDPADLPQRYADWHAASFEAGEIVEGELLEPRDLGEDRESITDYRVRSKNTTGEWGSMAQEIIFDDPAPSVVWLADGSALVSFRVTSYEHNYNTPRVGETTSCDAPGAGWWFWLDEPEQYRKLSYYGTVQIHAWVPARGDGNDPDQPASVSFIDPRPVQYHDVDQSIRC